MRLKSLGEIIIGIIRRQYDSRNFLDWEQRMARHGGPEANRIGMSLSMIAVLRNPPQGQVRGNAAGFRRASRSAPAAGDRQPRR